MIRFPGGKPDELGGVPGRVEPRARGTAREGLDGATLLAYTLELRAVSGLARDHMLELHESAGSWYHAAAAHDAAAAAGQPRLQAELRRRMQAREHAIFRVTEALSAAYARASRLLFPDEGLDHGLRRQQAIRRRDWRLERGRLLRASVGVDDRHPIADRRLRDDWVRYDELLDERIRTGGPVMQQCFVRTGEVPRDPRQPCMRLFEIDPPEVVLHLRGNAYRLDAIAGALRDVADRLPA